MLVTAGGKPLNIMQGLSVAEGKGRREMVLTAAYLDTAGEKLTLAAKGAFELDISKIARDGCAAAAESSF